MKKKFCYKIMNYFQCSIGIPVENLVKRLYIYRFADNFGPFCIKCRKLTPHFAKLGNENNSITTIFIEPLTTSLKVFIKLYHNNANLMIIYCYPRISKQITNIFRIIFVSFQ